MILITSTVRIASEHFASAIQQAKKHVAASRLEEGCLSHRYFVDPEQDDTIVFLECWRDQASIDLHFGQPGSLELVKNYRAWADGTLALQFHQVESTRELSL